MKIETVKIKSNSHPSGYIIVNKSDASKYAVTQTKPVQKRSGRAK